MCIYATVLYRCPGCRKHRETKPPKFTYQCPLAKRKGEDHKCHKPEDDDRRTMSPLARCCSEGCCGAVKAREASKQSALKKLVGSVGHKQDPHDQCKLTWLENVKLWDSQAEVEAAKAREVRPIHERAQRIWLMKLGGAAQAERRRLFLNDENHDRPMLTLQSLFGHMLIPGSDFLSEDRVLEI